MKNHRALTDGIMTKEIAHSTLAELPSWLTSTDPEKTPFSEVTRARLIRMGEEERATNDGKSDLYEKINHLQLMDEQHIDSASHEWAWAQRICREGPNVMEEIYKEYAPTEDDHTLTKNKIVHEIIWLAAAASEDSFAHFLEEYRKLRNTYLQKSEKNILTDDDKEKAYQHRLQYGHIIYDYFQAIGRYQPDVAVKYAPEIIDLLATHTDNQNWATNIYHHVVAANHPQLLVDTTGKPINEKLFSNLRGDENPTSAWRFYTGAEILEAAAEAIKLENQSPRIQTLAAITGNPIQAMSFDKKIKREVAFALAEGREPHIEEVVDRALEAIKAGDFRNDPRYTDATYFNDDKKAALAEHKEKFPDLKTIGDDYSGAISCNPSFASRILDILEKPYIDDIIDIYSLAGDTTLLALFKKSHSLDIETAKKLIAHIAPIAAKRQPDVVISEACTLLTNPETGESFLPLDDALPLLQAAVQRSPFHAVFTLQRNIELQEALKNGYAENPEAADHCAYNIQLLKGLRVTALRICENTIPTNSVDGHQLELLKKTRSLSKAS